MTVCDVKKTPHGTPILPHEAGWRIDGPDGEKLLSCDEHLSWLLNWNGGVNSVTAMVDQDAGV